MQIDETQITITLETYKLIEANRADFSESYDTIVRRALSSLSAVKSEQASVTPQASLLTRPSKEKTKRTRGEYNFELLGSQYCATSLKAAYLAIIAELAKRQDNFLELLSTKETHARRIVAKEKSDLYKKSKHLAKEHATEISKDYWIDTNLSEQQVRSNLRTACECANIEFGTDLRLFFTD